MLQSYLAQVSRISYAAYDKEYLMIVQNGNSQTKLFSLTIFEGWTQPVDHRVPLGSLLGSSIERIEDILAEHHPYYYTAKNVVRYE